MRAVVLIVALTCGVAVAGYVLGGVTGLAGTGAVIAVGSLAGRRTWDRDPGGALPGPAR